VAAYRIEIKPSAAKELAKLPRPQQQLIRRKIDALANDPHPRGCVKVQGEENAYRLRSGVYRIVYEVHDDVLVVFIIRIRHRREVYR